MISVIIPTYNGAELLRKSLDTWTQQTMHYDEFEVIVVDNNSTEDIYGVVKSFMGTDTNIRYVNEITPGATAARHKGVRESKGEYLVFSDNDGLVNSECLTELLKVYQCNSDCVAVACKIEILWDSEEPEWIEPYKYLLGQLDYGNEIIYRNDLYLNGGLMSIRKDIFEQVYGFNPDLIGSFLIGDGDTGLVRKLHREKMLIGWSPNSKMLHMQQVNKHGSVDGVALHFYNNGIADSYAKYRTENFSMNSSMMAYFSMQILALCKKWLQSRVLFRDDKALYFSYCQRLGALKFFSLLMRPEIKNQIQIMNVYQYDND